MTDRMEQSGFSGGTLILAVLGGAAVGAAVALLTAPQAGRATRSQISDVTRDGRDRARQLPGAVKAAGSAARGAFVEAMEASV